MDDKYLPNYKKEEINNLIINSKIFLGIDYDGNYGFIDNINFDVKKINSFEHQIIKNQLVEILFENCIC